MDSRYDRTARLLHWAIAALLLAQCAFGYWMGDVQRNTPDRAYIINLHKSVGMVIGVLILLRLYWRLRHAPPAMLSTLAQWQQKLAGATHHALYLCMALVPLSGYLASNFSKHGVKFFNTLTLAPWGSDDKAIYGVFNQTHKTAAFVLLAVAVVHVAAAVWHALQRDGVFERMSLRPF